MTAAIFSLISVFFIHIIVCSGQSCENFKDCNQQTELCVEQQCEDQCQDEAEICGPNAYCLTMISGVYCKCNEDPDVDRWDRDRLSCGGWDCDENTCKSICKKRTVWRPDGEGCVEVTGVADDDWNWGKL